MRTRSQPAHPLDTFPPGTSNITRPGPNSVICYIPTSPTPPSSSTPASTPALKTTIHLPPNSTWTSGLHFHTQHTEYLRLTRGCIAVRLNSKIITLSAAAGGEVSFHGVLTSRGLVVKVDKHVRHNWGRADHILRRTAIGARRRFPEDWTDDVVVEEWTDPADLSKPLFFWNLNRVVMGTKERGKTPSSTEATPRNGVAKETIRSILGSWWIPFQLNVIFWELDNWPIIADVEGIWTQDLDMSIRKSLVAKLEHGLEYVVTFLVLFWCSLVGRLIGVEAVEEERTPKELWQAWRIAKGAGRRND